MLFFVLFCYQNTTLLSWCIYRGNLGRSLPFFIYPSLELQWPLQPILSPILLSRTRVSQSTDCHVSPCAFWWLKGEQIWISPNCSSWGWSSSGVLVQRACSKKWDRYDLYLPKCVAVVSHSSPCLFPSGMVSVQLDGREAKISLTAGFSLV